MWEEHQDNQFEESQIMRSYSAGVIDGLGIVLGLLSNDPSKESPIFPISLSFYDENDAPVYHKSHEVEMMREHIFDLQHKKSVPYLYEEVN
jgi:hypothetical protein